MRPSPVVRIECLNEISTIAVSLDGFGIREGFIGGAFLR